MAFVASADTSTVEQAVEAVRMASRSLSRLLDADPSAIGVLEALDLRAPVDRTSVDALVRWKSHEFLRIAARDLVGLDSFETVGGALADLAANVFDAAVELSEVRGLAVIGMGKLGGCELNYALDVDVDSRVRSLRSIRPPRHAPAMRSSTSPADASASI